MKQPNGKRLIEPAKSLPVICEVDVCVIGGSCTGVFAAVRAARLGAKTAIIEKQNCFGGTATCGMINIWHPLYDTEHNRQIIAGLTAEVIERLKKRDAVVEKIKEPDAYHLNTEELKIELDELVLESGIIPHLHTFFAAPYLEEDKLAGVIVENKSCRAAVKASVFIDASGDGDLCAKLNLPHWTSETRQPPSTCSKIYGQHTLGEFNIAENIRRHGKEFDLPDIYGWWTFIPQMSEVALHAFPHIHNAKCEDASSLTHSEIEGRRQVRAIMDLIRKYGPEGSKVALLALSSYMAVRETRHFRCKYHLTEPDLLCGRRFEDAIANGTYRVDIHYDDRPEVVLRYLDGRESLLRFGQSTVERRWRAESDNDPTFYQIPYRSMLPKVYDNLILAGRMIDTDEGAFGAIRVMVNTNQTGEAAGTAAWLALDSNKSLSDIDILRLRKTLENGGSIVI